MNAPARQSDLIAALQARFIASPMLANGYVTGDYSWPPEKDIEELYVEALDLVDKASDPLWQGSSIERDMRIAAANALGWLADEARDRRRAENDAYENRTAMNVNGGA